MMPGPNSDKRQETVAEILSSFYRANEENIRQCALECLLGQRQEEDYRRYLHDQLCIFIEERGLESLLYGQGDDAPSYPKAGVLHTCITQTPEIITQPCDQRDFAFAGISAQLPLYQGEVTHDTSANSLTNDPRLLESAGVLQLNNNPLTWLIYPTPNDQFIASQFNQALAALPAPKEWETIRQSFLALCDLPLERFNTEAYTHVLWSFVEQLQHDLIDFFQKHGEIITSSKTILAIASMLLHPLIGGLGEAKAMSGIHTFIHSLPNRLLESVKEHDFTVTVEGISDVCDAMRRNISCLIAQPLEGEKAYGGLFPHQSPQEKFAQDVESFSDITVSGDQVAVSGEIYHLPESFFAISKEKTDAEILFEFLEKNIAYLSSIKCSPEIYTFILEKLWDKFTSDARCTLSQEKKNNIKKDLTVNYLDYCAKVLFEKKQTLLQDSNFIASCSSKATIENKSFDSVLREKLSQDLKSMLSVISKSMPGFNEHIKDTINLNLEARKILAITDIDQFKDAVENSLRERAKESILKYREYFDASERFGKKTQSIEGINTLSMSDCVAALDGKTLTEAKEATQQIDNALAAVVIVMIYGPHLDADAVILNDERVRLLTALAGKSDDSTVNFVAACQFLRGKEKLIKKINDYYATHLKDKDLTKVEEKIRQNAVAALLPMLLRRKYLGKDVTRILNSTGQDENSKVEDLLMPKTFLEPMQAVKNLNACQSINFVSLKALKGILTRIIKEFKTILPNPETVFSEIIKQYTDFKDIHRFMPDLLSSLHQPLFEKKGIDAYIMPMIGAFFDTLNKPHSETDFYQFANSELEKLFKEIDINDKTVPKKAVLQRIFQALWPVSNVQTIEEKLLESIGTYELSPKEMADTMNDFFGKVDNDFWIDYVINYQLYDDLDVLHNLRQLAEEGVVNAKVLVVSSEVLSAARKNADKNLVQIINNIDQIDESISSDKLLTNENVVAFIREQLPQRDFGGKPAIEALLNKSIPLAQKLHLLGRIGQGKTKGEHQLRGEELRKFYEHISILANIKSEQDISPRFTEFLHNIEKCKNSITDIEKAFQERRLTEKFVIYDNRDKISDVLVVMEKFDQNSMVAQNSLVKSDDSFIHLLKNKIDACEKADIEIKAMHVMSLDARPSNQLPRQEEEIVVYMQRLLSPILLNEEISTDRKIAIVKAVGEVLSDQDKAKAIIDQYAELIVTTASLIAPISNIPSRPRDAIISANSSALVNDNAKELSLFVKIAVKRIVASFNHHEKQRDISVNKMQIGDELQKISVSNKIGSLLKDRKILSDALIKTINQILETQPSVIQFLEDNLKEEIKKLNEEDRKDFIAHQIKIFVKSYLELLEKPNDSVENIRHNFLLRQSKEAILSAFDLKSRRIESSSVKFIIDGEKTLACAFDDYLWHYYSSNKNFVDVVAECKNEEERTYLINLFLTKNCRDGAKISSLIVALEKQKNVANIKQISGYIRNNIDNIQDITPLISFIAKNSDDNILFYNFSNKYQKTLSIMQSFSQELKMNKDSLEHYNSNQEVIGGYVTVLVREQLQKLSETLKNFHTARFKSIFFEAPLPEGMKKMVDLIGDSEKPVNEIISEIQKIAAEKVEGAGNFKRDPRTIAAYKAVHEFLGGVELDKLHPHEEKLDNLTQRLQAICRPE